MSEGWICPKPDSNVYNARCSKLEDKLAESNWRFFKMPLRGKRPRKTFEDLCACKMKDCCCGLIRIEDHGSQGHDPVIFKAYSQAQTQQGQSRQYEMIAIGQRVDDRSRNMFCFRTVFSGTFADPSRPVNRRPRYFEFPQFVNPDSSHAEPLRPANMKPGAFKAKTAFCTPFLEISQVQVLVIGLLLFFFGATACPMLYFRGHRVVGMCAKELVQTYSFFRKG